ncbi:hypothetical protein ABTZ59_36460, partial [Streptomyces sp. NPDC094034]
KYVQYMGDPPPCDARHQTPRAYPRRSTGQDLRAYLCHVADQAAAAFTAGRTWRQASDEIDLDVFAGWSEPERVVATVHTIYRELDPAMAHGTPADVFRHMAHWRAARHG